jgi:glycine/D-amino acid oxidase-like deaminating enzyme
MIAGRGRVAVIGAGPAGMATALSVHQAGHDVLLFERYPQASFSTHASPPVQAVRDAVLDHTPLLQKVVGKSAPGEILKQLTAIDAAEQRFAAIRGGAGR